MNQLESCTNLNTISLNEQINYRLSEISKIKDYFESEIKERELVIKKLSKYITGFDYADKILIISWTIFSNVSIFSRLKIKKHTGLISSVFTLSISLITAIIKKLYETKKRKKKHNKVYIMD